ncbi:MAG: flagellar protein FliT [Phycisphaeraceae bacterium]|nr:MAG: flagellar protein FliT [Phycisphaeraceae bacterium]
MTERTITHNPTELDVLLALLDRQAAAYRTLATLSAELASAATSGDGERVDDLLARRGPVVARLVEGARVIDLSREDLARAQASGDAGVRAAVTARLDEIRECAGRIAGDDREALDHLRGRRDETKEQLHSLRRGGQASEAYRPAGSSSSPDGPSFQDRRG